MKVKSQRAGRRMMARHFMTGNIIMANTRAFRYLLLCGAAIAISAQSAGAQDVARGRQLYETHCGDCHYQRVHQRERAKSLIRNLDDLRAQVGRWAPQTRRPLAGQDLADIADYLNASYYRLEK
jgi:mono/diheme cytochrome c family protein